MSHAKYPHSQRRLKEVSSSISLKTANSEQLNTCFFIHENNHNYDLRLFFPKSFNPLAQYLTLFQIVQANKNTIKINAPRSQENPGLLANNRNTAEALNTA